MASLWKLPVVYVCENNKYAISTHVKTASASKTIAQKAQSYDIPGVLVDGNDVLEVYHHAKKAIERARAGEGPTLIECETYRFRGHHEGDEQTYRTKEEVEEWKAKCPILRLKALLEKEYGWTEEEHKTTIDSVEAKIKEAVEFGLRGTPVSGENLEKYVFEAEVL